MERGYGRANEGGPLIWVPGGKGMLGTDLVVALRKNGYRVLSTDVETDVRDRAVLENFLRANPVDWVINCCAYAAVDQAESDKKAAFAINSDGAANIASVGAALGAQVVHISTDYVFDGQADRPYDESDPVAPVGVYARSKAEGEQRVMATAPGAYVLRTAWLYGEHGGNFVHTMLRLMGERDHISVVADQRGSPTWTMTLCDVISKMIQQDVRGGGIYHVTNKGEASWYEFAVAIRTLAMTRGVLSRLCKVTPISTEAYPTPAPRPPYSILACAKIAALLNIALPSWRDSLATFVNDMETKG